MVGSKMALNHSKPSTTSLNWHIQEEGLDGQNMNGANTVSDCLTASLKGNVELYGSDLAITGTISNRPVQ